MTQIVDEETSSTGIINFIFVSFAVLALLLAAAGLYGVISFTFGVGIGLMLAWGLAVASASVLFVAVVAVWVPASRAMRVDPITALRAD